MSFTHEKGSSMTDHDISAPRSFPGLPSRRTRTWREDRTSDHAQGRLRVRRKPAIALAAFVISTSALGFAPVPAHADVRDCTEADKRDSSGIHREGDRAVV